MNLYEIECHISSRKPSGKMDFPAEPIVQIGQFKYSIKMQKLPVYRHEWTTVRTNYSAFMQKCSSGNDFVIFKYRSRLLTYSCLTVFSPLVCYIKISCLHRSCTAAQTTTRIPSLKKYIQKADLHLWPYLKRSDTTGPHSPQKHWYGKIQEIGFIYYDISLLDLRANMSSGFYLLWSCSLFLLWSLKTFAVRYTFQYIGA